MRRLLLATSLLLACPAFADDAPSITALGARLEKYDYPYPAQFFEVHSQGQTLQMAYMDLKPAHPNGRTAVLLHGKNFCAPYWTATAERLRDKGYRVVVPDQIGFCKSSKPRGYQYSIHQLAANTHALLASLGADKVTMIAHSMGGMIGARYALMFPQGVEKLVLVDPIGLEDWKAKGVPWRSVDDWYANELKTSFASIKAYQLKSYYGGNWRPEYSRWVALQAGMYEGGGRETAAWAGALTYDMVFTQPVVYEFPDIRVPTVLIIGQRDRTAVGRDLAPADVAAKLGDYPALGKEAASRIPGAKLIPLEGLGHSPMLEAPERFYMALDEAL
ncbi:pimeloyl-ACP methyl ester carboxylesterase [Luteibacter rhizovicinus]|uniref:Pimeloyl-ACP methyl ester carboxylesterase n=1 Tax=Luteibacter rhizovicinus TaxID=242606 RepID=A0A4V2W3E3_9GAMM|nr:alpha/beta hydrolase [Luteibacter rhizovicinus]TCV91609.1 pimeloyl-ACP methyl ester carboxylesterase [Luteibacter rhizovicinus]